MKILYVEDNDDNVYMLKNRLSRAGFTIIVATNGAQVPRAEKRDLGRPRGLHRAGSWRAHEAGAQAPRVCG
jgi:CheY-like chemotaxis protein